MARLMTTTAEFGQKPPARVQVRVAPTKQHRGPALRLSAFLRVCDFNATKATTVVQPVH